MDNTILTTLIAAGAACLGAFVPSLFSYLGKQKEFRNDRKAKLEEMRIKEYKMYIEALQAMVNNNDRESFELLQVSTNSILLFAGQKLSNIICRYYNDLIQRALQNMPLTLEEQTIYQTNIFNAMREELGITNDKLEKVIMVKAGF